MLRHDFRLGDAIGGKTKADRLLFTTFLATTAVNALKGDTSATDMDALLPRLMVAWMKQRLRASICASTAEGAFAMLKIELRQRASGQLHNLRCTGSHTVATSITAHLMTPPRQRDRPRDSFALSGKEFAS
ncbi:hypothetical protein HA50_14115 [Pantoea cypripedii]|uniref:Uncharacterized protein n=1 Tax=Pantoea cypripedii TaxID=55209 RepID=A0A1X1EX18_PANCY|nr:hypothetical protein [Pantoea cypripedii]ORM94423.1 hypothetical protein HA50_14115 [Pantoea cypripedii]